MPTAKRHLAVVAPPDAIEPAKGAQAPGDHVRDLEHKAQVLFDQASDAILSVRQDGVVVEVNPAFEDASGYMKTEICGKSCAVLIPEGGVNRIPHRARPLSLSILETPGTYEDVAILRKDGYVRLVDMSIRTVPDGGKAVSYAVFRDVTEKKLLERELITKHSALLNAYNELERGNLELKSMQDTLVQAGKMAALGELAAGIAHELNQPLQGIRGYAQELEAMVMPELSGRKIEENAGSWFKEIVSNVDKMSKIIGYLRTFTRKSAEEHKETDVHEIIEEALKMFARQFAARGIAVERDFGDGVAKIWANPLGLEQVFINFAANARDAIEATGRGSGTIGISTRMAGRDFVEVKFKDDGVGMDEFTKAKAFNPFFTTKEVGKGMGLGLSLSYGILTRIHGTIVVESHLGKGTTFVARLPRDYRQLA